MLSHRSYGRPVNPDAPHTIRHTHNLPCRRPGGPALRAVSGCRVSNHRTSCCRSRGAAFRVRTRNDRGRRGRAPSCPGSIGGRPARLRDQAVQGVEGSSARERTGHDRVHRVRGRYLSDLVFTLLRRRSRRYEGRPGRHRPGYCSSIGENTVCCHSVSRSPRFCARSLVSGCDESLETVAGPTPDLTPTLTSIQRDIFQASDSSGRPSCASCHNPNGGAFRAVGLDLSTEGTHDSLVGVASRQKPKVLRVAPGDPANSYLIQKIEGRGRYRRRAHAATRAVSDGRTDRDHQALDRAWRQERLRRD